MRVSRDSWGERVPASSSTFSLATILRVVTAICLALGWCSVVRLSPYATIHVLAAVSLALAAIVAWRQRGGLWTKVAIATAYFLGVAFVGIHTALLFVAFFPPPWAGEDRTGLASIAGTCLGLLALPLLAIIFLALLRTWLHLAADATDRA